MKLDAPFIQKHSAFEALLLPFATIVMIHTDMTELIKYRHYEGSRRRNTLRL